MLDETLKPFGNTDIILCTCVGETVCQHVEIHISGMSVGEDFNASLLHAMQALGGREDIDPTYSRPRH
jgi:hypothetical protein